MSKFTAVQSLHGGRSWSVVDEYGSVVRIYANRADAEHGAALRNAPRGERAPQPLDYGSNDLTAVPPNL